MNANRLNGDDRLSSLPDDVLCHILSFLPTKLAAATSVLSTRWKHLPDLVPDIDLRDYNVGGTKPAQVYSLEEKDHASARFMEFVLKVLMVRTFPTVREIPKFRLSCRMVHDHDILCQSILLLLMRNIRELNLSVNLLDSDTLPDEIYQCKALEYLEIGSELHLNVSESVVLPNLKVIKLHSVYFYGDSSVRKLLSGCPVLEDLSLSICLFREDTVEICHPLLKNLTLVHSVVEDHIIFDTPNLCNLFYVSDTDLTFEVKNMESLVHAHISWGSTETQLKQYKYQDLENLSVNSSNGTKFINAMLKARFLYLEGSSINALYFSDCGMTTFQNLIVMEVGSTNVSEWLVLPDLLASTPNLKVLVFYEGFINCNSRVNKADYRLPDIAPTCFSRSLEEIKIGVFDGHKCELELVEYFLKSVECLKMMMIGAKVSSVSPFGYPRFFRPLNFLRKRPEWVLSTSQRLSVAPRCSEDCQIMLTWLSGRKKYGQKIL